MLQSVMAFIDILKDSNIRPEKLLLFGSRARGDFNKSSDIDLLLISKDVENDKNTVYRAVYEALNKFDTYLSVKVLDESEFTRLKNFGTPFINNVLSDAKVLWPKQ